MIDTEDAHERLDKILNVFENYIGGQDYFNIVYSMKVGYVWIIADKFEIAGAKKLDTPETVLECLFILNINDVIAPHESTSPTEPHALTEDEERECRHRITDILRTMEDFANEYLNCLDNYLKNYQERYHENNE